MSGDVIAMPEPTKLSIRGTRHRLTRGAYAIEVDAGDGGRIVEFSLDGKNVLATRDDSPAAFGSSFWPSPQSDWDWPPPPEFDRMPWNATPKETFIALASATNPALGLSASESVSMHPRIPGIQMTFSIENRGSSKRSVAPWQNTRMRPGGLTFYPSAGDTLPGSTLELPLIDGVAWLLHDPATMTENRKSFADGSEGFLAHAADGMLFVKVWKDVPRQLQAPGEGEIELYVDKTGRFVEIEQQGRYQELAPGDSLHWKVEWFAERLRADARIEPGNGPLLAQARYLAFVARNSRPEAKLVETP